MNLLSFMFVICLALFTSCDDEIIVPDPTDPIGNSGNGSDNDMGTNADEGHLIVLSAPSVYNNYYASVFDQIIDYLANFANLVDGKDEVIILADAETLPYLEGKVPAEMLVEANVEDIWIRDFSPVIPSRQVKFNYLPDFQSASVSNLIDNSFEDWFLDNGLEYGMQTDLILDGGNVVDNGSNRAIITDRFLWDNPELTEANAKAQLKILLGVNEVAIIPEVEGDATGHADGMVMFTDANTVLLHELPEPQHTQTIQELEAEFPGIHIVEVADYYEEDSWQGFTSACNIFVNSVVTDEHIYMPTFNSEYDDEMFDLMQANTDKVVIRVPAQDVCFMGGSVRCLSWQVKGANKEAILSW